MPYFIRKYGSPANWDTSAFETAHKHLVKAFYKRGSKRTSEVARETLTAVRMSTVVDCDRQSMACSLTRACLTTQHASWNALCRECVIEKNGAFSNHIQRHTEIGVQQIGRAHV